MSLEIEIPAALAYARTHALHAIVIALGDQIVAQEYGGGFDAKKPHLLYSGTKSFWGPAALCAREDGLLELDETVAATFAAWRDDPWKRRVTLRMLLSLTAGFGFGGLGAAVPEYERALETPLKNEPGSRFTYGGIPFQVFGAVLARKLADRKLTPHDYLRQRDSRARRRPGGELAQPKGRNASPANRRIALRHGLARIRTLRRARGRPSRALLRGLSG